ncbi:MULTISPECIES: hypothetical protein [Sulfolobaceae]|uniref:hypothetical protein n=1 Tax=Sulfolobaceae TaxID=118883 RepID=UPI001E460899|nr:MULTISPECIES: hypothetical protein [unclassified Sulfolobus]
MEFGKAKYRSLSIKDINLSNNLLIVEREVRRMLDKAERMVDRCLNCGNLECDECEEARQLLDEIRDMIRSIDDERAAKRFSIILDDLESKLENLG